jgi:hypothetical protein
MENNKAGSNFVLWGAVKRSGAERDVYHVFLNLFDFLF